MNWLAQQFGHARDIVLHSTVFFAGSILLALAGLGGYAIYQRDQSKPPAIEAPPIEPVTIAVIGPRPPIVIEGVTTTLFARVSGPAGKPKWSLQPAGGGASVKDSTDGQSTEFLANQAGHFSIMVTVGGDGRQVAADQIDVEVVSLKDEPAPMPQPGPGDIPPMPPVMPQPAAHVPTVAELAAGALNQVESENKAAEAKTVAGSIMSLIGRINAGSLDPNTDPIIVLEEQLGMALGPNAGKWRPFLVSIALTIEQLRQQGQVTTIASTVPTLAEIAGVLRQSR